MVGLINYQIIFTTLGNIINNKSNNLLKNTNKNILINMKKKLESENFDGWFTSIENSATVEVCLLNDKNIFTIIKQKKFKENSK